MHVRHGTAYGLDSSPDQHWSMRAACRPAPELFFDDRLSARAAALHVCLEHCPVLEQCRRAAAPLVEQREHRSLVIGGVSYNHLGEESEARPAASCARCRPLERYMCEGGKHGSAAAVRLHRQRGEELCWQCHGGDRDRRRRTERRQLARAARVAAWNEQWPEGGPRDG